MELEKVNEEIATLHAEYNKLVQEWDEVVQIQARLHQAMQEVYSNIPEVYIEENAPLEEQEKKINEAIQGFRANIVDLEAHTTPSTPLEERKQREKTTMTTVERIKSLDEECVKLYEETTQVWNQLLDM
jgi:uncharacterized phage infection (PIP) family protein YhgE